MRCKIVFLAVAAVATAAPQTTTLPPPTAMLNSGLPNIYPATRPLLTGASDASPALNPPSGSSLCAAYPAPTCVVTVQYNNSRTDANPWETVFTNANVPNLTLLAQFPVNTMGLPSAPPPFTQNPIYAQPLYVPNLSISGGTHDVVFITTLNGEVYAYDADNTSTPTKLWYRDETGPAGMQGLKHNCDVGLTMGSSVDKKTATGYLAFAGVISTPVIDAAPESPNPAAIYVVNLCQRSDSSQHWYINALNLTTGATLTSPPIEFVYNAADVAANPYGPQQVFFPSSQLQRTGLLLTYSTSSYARSVIAGFGTSVSGTTTQYQGWVFSFDVTNPSNVVNQEYANPYITQCFFNETGTGSVPSCTSNPHGYYDAQLPNPCGQGGGVWMSARGPASNANQEVFLASGNGGFQYCPSCAHYCAGSPTNYIQEITDFGEAVMGIKMQNVWSTTSGQAPFWPTDYFVPDAVPAGVGTGAGYFEILNYNDWDLGVTGTLLFDDSYYDSANNTTYSDVSMLLAAAKRGDGYVLQQNFLGQITTTDQYAVNHFLLSQGAASGGSNPMCTASSDGMECDEPRTPAYWRPYNSEGLLPSVLVVWPWFEDLASFQWQQNAGPAAQYNFAPITTANNPFSGPTGYPGGTLALTFNPEDTAGNAVVWAVATSPTVDTGYLLAYSLTPAGVLSSNPIWPTLPLSTAQFLVAPYAIPTAVNGKVYVPTYGMPNGSGGYTSGIAVYGLP